MKTKQVTSLLLATLFLAFCFQEAESTFKLKKLIKAGLILKALSPRKIILPIPIPIPINFRFLHKRIGHLKKFSTEFMNPLATFLTLYPIFSRSHKEHHYEHDYHGGHGGHYDYGHHGGYGYNYGHHQPVVYHSTGWYLDKDSHGWH